MKPRGQVPVTYSGAWTVQMCACGIRRKSQHSRAPGGHGEWGGKWVWFGLSRKSAQAGRALGPEGKLGLP